MKLSLLIADKRIESFTDTHSQPVDGEVWLSLDAEVSRFSPEEVQRYCMRGYNLDDLKAYCAQHTAEPQYEGSRWQLVNDDSGETIASGTCSVPVPVPVPAKKS